MRIVVLGGGFSGLNAASWLGKKWPANKHEIILVAENEHFVFKPSLIWVSFDHKKGKNIMFPLATRLAKIGISYVQDKVVKVMPNENTVILQNDGPLHYDYLVLATGSVPDWGYIPGLRGQTSSLYDMESTLKTTGRLKGLRSGDPVVIGVTQLNTLPSIAYEFLFELDEYLREEKIETPITFFTYEQHLLEQAGKKVSEIVEKRMLEKPFHIYREVKIKKMRRGHIHLDNGMKLPYSFSMIVPPYKGAAFVFASKQLKHENGLLKTNDHLQVNGFSNVYAAGDLVLPKAGYLTNGHSAELQGRYVAKDIYRRIEGLPDQPVFKNEVMATWELGTEGAVLAIKYPNSKQPGTFHEWAYEGRIPHVMKKAFEKYYLAKFT